jgi:hypothetical protein
MAENDKYNKNKQDGTAASKASPNNCKQALDAVAKLEILGKKINLAKHPDKVSRSIYQSILNNRKLPPINNKSQDSNPDPLTKSGGKTK